MISVPPSAGRVTAFSLEQVWQIHCFLVRTRYEILVIRDLGRSASIYFIVFTRAERHWVKVSAPLFVFFVSNLICKISAHALYEISLSPPSCQTRKLVFCCTLCLSMILNIKPKRFWIFAKKTISESLKKSRCFAFPEFAVYKTTTAVGFVFDRENCGLCALEQLTIIPLQRKCSLKQEWKLYCVFR